MMLLLLFHREHRQSLRPLYLSCYQVLPQLYTPHVDIFNAGTVLEGKSAIIRIRLFQFWKSYLLFHQLFRFYLLQLCTTKPQHLKYPML